MWSKAFGPTDVLRKIIFLQIVARYVVYKLIAWQNRIFFSLQMSFSRSFRLFSLTL